MIRVLRRAVSRNAVSLMCTVFITIPLYGQTLVNDHNLPGRELAILEPFDADGDGVSELVLSGLGANETPSTLMLSLANRSEGEGRVDASFATVAHPLPGIYRGGAATTDYNLDGFDDILVTGLTAAESGEGDPIERPVTALFRSEQAVTDRVLRRVEAAPFPDLYDSGAAWGDYDGDGDPDLILAGRGPTGEPQTGLYRNEHIGTGLTWFRIEVGFPPLANPDFDWGDVDGDGDLDVLMAGLGPSDASVIALFRNDDGIFVEVDVEWPALYLGDVQWGDYDGDGDLDILLVGAAADPWLFRPFLFVYENEGGSFRRTEPGLQVGFGGSAAWIDLDDDGDLDLSVMGIERLALSGARTRVFQNVDGAYEPWYVLGGVALGSALWYDYDGNGRPDLLIVGRQDDGLVSLLFEL